MKYLLVLCVILSGCASFQTSQYQRGCRDAMKLHRMDRKEVRDLCQTMEEDESGYPATGYPATIN